MQIHKQYPSRYSEKLLHSFDWEFFVSTLDQYGVEYQTIKESVFMEIMGEIVVLQGIDRKIAHDLYLKYFIVNEAVHAHV